MKCFDFNTLILFRDGELDEASARNVDAHVANCAKCSSTLKNFNLVREAVSVRHKPPHNMHYRIIHGIKSQKRAIWIGRLAAAAACLLIAVSVTLVLMNTRAFDDEIEDISGSPEISKEIIETRENQTSQVTLKDKGVFRLYEKTNLFRGKDKGWDVGIGYGKFYCNAKRKLVVETPVVPVRVSSGGKFELQVSFMNADGDYVTSNGEVYSALMEVKVHDGSLQIENRAYNAGQSEVIVKHCRTKVKPTRDSKKFFEPFRNSKSVYYEDDFKSTLNSKERCNKEEIAKLIDRLGLKGDKAAKFKKMFCEHEARYQNLANEEANNLRKLLGSKIKTAAEWNTFVKTKEGKEFMKTRHGHKLMNRMANTRAQLHLLTREMSDLLAGNEKAKQFLSEYYKVLGATTKD